ncbi:MAG TPA: hypothetical protein VK837_05220 [Longimicrobiales bacterium]|nr:hypothetical protein [Longimicrobiales bacterium]
MTTQQARPIPTADEVATVLREVLAGPEFQRTDAGESFLGGLYRRILEWLAERSIDLPALPGGTLVSALAIAVLFAALALAVRALVRRRVGAASRLARGQTPPAPAEAAIHRSAEAWEARARELAAAGRTREAALALYHSVVRRFADAGIIRYHVSKTPGDYRREIRGLDIVRPYGEFLAGFEPIAFGPSGGDVQGLFPLARAAVPAASP